MLYRCNEGLLFILNKLDTLRREFTEEYEIIKGNYTSLLTSGQIAMCEGKNKTSLTSLDKKV